MITCNGVEVKNTGGPWKVHLAVKSGFVLCGRVQKNLLVSDVREEVNCRRCTSPEALARLASATTEQ